MAINERDIALLTKGIAGPVREAIAAAVVRLREQVAALEQRLAVAESKSLEYLGTWKPGAYRKGSAVTWGGSVFIAMAATQAKPGEPGEASRAWVLAVKRGADGRDATP